MIFAEHSRRGVWLSVAGVIGVGKTTLFDRLKKEVPNSLLFREEWERNPYLKDSYKEHPSSVYLSQRWFLETKAKQIRTIQKVLRQKVLILQEPPLGADFAYAATLHDEKKISDEDWEKYLRRFHYLANTLPHPTLLIYLSATEDNVMSRIKRRGRDFEVNMKVEHIQRLIQYNEQQIREEQKHHPLAVLCIATNTLNLADNNPDQQLVLRMIQDRLQRLFPPKEEPMRTNGHGPIRRLRGRR
ncbi:MAG TPA: hypothetical protein DCX25_00635 [Candidatus Pacebacteria bacterium]|nr:MAG: Deoxynucleoside kinase [Microgenomates group bacterium GW2011_GWB1_45_17]KKU22932.1 MAG: Deoxynucleoside kinase [Microgenomates group bacterium GW2011_GWA1_46_15]KKU24083.1 MAG: Deoxynucleoside kinase [Microgenomates group bacterium GW2011_GWC1_46_15]HAV14828.1 hypothetical protein [Candidatus Paceibacterota bacterium]HCR11219.1 hypothetical protein [Candidatus Paceibacterota bacterium]